VKPLLVGETNPYGSDPRFALYPRPLGSAGSRFCHVILGMEEPEYLDAFDRVNLLVGPKWSAPKARLAARALLDGTPKGKPAVLPSHRFEYGQPLVLLGARVARAFRLSSTPFVLHPWGDGRGDHRQILVLPHPSGRCRRWNEPGTFEKARKAVRSLRESVED
jgi:hypothetical protein